MSKYNTILLALGLGFGIIAHGQVAKKPSIMVVPVTIGARKTISCNRMRCMERR